MSRVSQLDRGAQCHCSRADPAGLSSAFRLSHLVVYSAPQARLVLLQGIRTLSAAASEPAELHDAIAAERFQQGSVLDWDPDAYRAKTGGGIPRVLHHIFLDGEQEYDR